MPARSRILILFAAALLAATAAHGQGNPTGRITGRVTDVNKYGLPGVRVDVTSPSLQQPRRVFTHANGDYLIGALPGGEYQLTFELEAFAPEVAVVEVSIAQVKTLDVSLTLGWVDGCLGPGIVDRDAISKTHTGATTYTQDLVEKLAVDRTITQAVALAPGTAATGLGGGISISGGPSFDNLYLINGVPIDENLRGQPSDLFIEDAIQETTVLSSGLSAEYGRFSGGVVNIVTKSGSNAFSGSFRDNLSNEKWAAATPFGEERADSVDDTFEATLGGYLWKDRLWFFTAGRQLERTGVDPTDLTGIFSPTRTKETRFGGKLTFALTPRHQLQLDAVDNRVEVPERSRSAIYTGVPINNFLVEAQHSKSSLQFLGIWPNPDTRETETAQLEGSYFLSFDNGSHDLVFGIDTLIVRQPILRGSLGAKFISNSAYVNDRWDLGAHWSFNLGLRYDENDGSDSAGNTIATDSHWSPRLGVNYDPKGDGDLVLHASAGRYVTRIDSTLDSPKADEITLGFSRSLKYRGLIRVDYVRRDFGDFYQSRNDDRQLERVYDGLHTSFAYQLSDRLSLRGSWTWSHARGNFDGETVRTDPVVPAPEHSDFSQTNPRRDLLIDQRHKVRTWFLWDAIAAERHQLTVSVLQSFFSGAKYGGVGSFDSRSFVGDLGDVTPPAAVTSYYTAPDAFETDDITQTDLALNYSFHWQLAERDFEIFVQPEILNLLDEQGIETVNTSDVLDATNTDDDYQTPRTFRLSLGFRF